MGESTSLPSIHLFDGSFGCGHDTKGLKEEISKKEKGLESH